MKVHKIVPYKNAKGEERIMLCVTEQNKKYANAKGANKFGSVVLSKDFTPATAEKEFPVGSTINDLAFGEQIEGVIYEVLAV